MNNSTNFVDSVAPLLVIDHDRRWIEDVKNIASKFNTGVVSADAVSDAGSGSGAGLEVALRHVLNDEKRFFSAILYNPVVPAGGGVSLIRAIRESHPMTPVFITCKNGRRPFSERELYRMGLHAMVSDHEQLKRLVFVSAAAPAPGAEASLSDAVASELDLSSSSDARAVALAQGFVLVPIRGVPAEARVFFDVYVRLVSGRYLKVLRAGDSFGASRLGGYVRRGIGAFYIRKDAQLRCLNYCNVLAGFILQNDGVSLAFKTLHVLDRGVALLESLRKNLSLTESQLDDVDEFVADAWSIALKIRGAGQEEMDHVFSYLPAYENAVGVTILASLLAMSLEFSSAQTIKLLGVAAFFHDIGLYALDPSIHHAEESKMSVSERELYRSHPLKGAELLEKTAMFGETVIQAVAQHHERRDNSGFPRRVAPGTGINRLAEVVGISDEFFRRLRRGYPYPSLALLAEMQNGVLNGFSMPVVEAFKKTFFSNYNTGNDNPSAGSGRFLNNGRY